MFYLLHGDDEFTSREQLKKLRQQGQFEYNQDTYYGGEVALSTITTTCDTLPFLAEQRLVIVERNRLAVTLRFESRRPHQKMSLDIAIRCGLSSYSKTIQMARNGELYQYAF